MSGLINTATYYKNLSLNLQKYIITLHEQRNNNKEKLTKFITQTTYEINKLKNELNEKNHIISLLQEEILSNNPNTNITKNTNQKSTQDLDKDLDKDFDKDLAQDLVNDLDKQYNNAFISTQNGINYLFTFNDLGILCIKEQL